MGYMSVEFDVKSPVYMFFYSFLEILELSIDNAKTKEPELQPEEKNKVQYKIKGVQLSKWYKKIASLDRDIAMGQDPDWYTKLEGTMTVTDTEYNSGGRAGRAYWTVKYEKIHDDVPDPRFITDTTASLFEILDEIILPKP